MSADRPSTSPSGKPGVVDGFGYLKLSRKAFECHEFWRERRTFSKWEAMLDLFQLAAYQDHAVHANGHTVTIPRGHALVSVRMLADRWRWSNPKVSRFLGRLVSDETLCTASVTPSGTLYRLVNYELYQGDDTATVTPGVTETERQANTDVHKKKKGKKGKEGKAPAGAGASRGVGGAAESEAPASTEAPKVNWVAVLVDDHHRLTGGVIEAGRLGKALKPLYAEHGLDALRPAMRAFLLSDQAKFGINYFAEHFGRYAPAAASVALAMPPVQLPPANRPAPADPRAELRNVRADWQGIRPPDGGPSRREWAGRLLDCDDWDRRYLHIVYPALAAALAALPPERRERDTTPIRPRLQPAA